MYAEDEDDFIPISMDLRSQSTNNAKWIGCANHNLQLALKVLDGNQKFSKVVKNVLVILRKVKGTPTALNEFRSQSGRKSIVLPVATR